MAKLSAAKIAVTAHLALVKEGVAPHNDLSTTPPVYRTVLNKLATLAISDVKLSMLKEAAEKLYFYRFNGKSDVFAQAIWDARKHWLEQGKQQTKGKSSGESTDAATDTSTSA